MNKASDGKGGGKPNFAQGGTPNTKSLSASAWIFFTELIFLSNFKRIRSAKKAEPFSSSLLPQFIAK